MWVRSQDQEMVANINALWVEWDQESQQCSIKGATGENDSLLLAVFHTREEAMDELDKFEAFLEKVFIL